jgi:ABC-type branched-subunit amino acid transport system substrate-binding protein
MPGLPDRLRPRARARAVSAALLLIVLVGCHPAPAPAPAARPRAAPATPDARAEGPVGGAPIRIGGIFNLGADGGPTARAGWESARLAVDEINTHGGVLLPDGSRRRLELVAYDDDGVPERTRPVIRSLVEEDGSASPSSR